MAALDFTELSKPVADDGPCGPDLEDDTDFMNVTARLEVALPSAYFRRDDEGRQVPFDRTSIDFPAAFADLGKLMARSQDLRLFVLAAKLSILNRDVAGFTACLSAMADILGENWDAVHPRAMDGDFIMRDVALQGLDELPTVVLPLQHAPLFVSRRIGPFAFRSQLVAIGETKLVEGEQHPDSSAIQAALADVDAEELTAILGRIDAARDALARLRKIWLEKVGVDHPLGFPRLAALLDQIAAFLGAAVARRVPGHETAAAPAGGDAQKPAASPASFGPGSLSSILQVEDTLAGCLGYFRRTEPSSPAVLLIGQAQQLIGKSLIEVIQIMFPDHIDKAVLEIGDSRRFRLPLERLPGPGHSGSAAAQAGDDGAPEESYDEGEADKAIDGEAAGEGEAAADGAAQEDSGAAAMPATAAPEQAAIAIGSRAEAVGAMKAVAAFYRQVEPSHPTPLLMDKACALAQHDFMSLLGNILPEVAQLPDADS